MDIIICLAALMSICFVLGVMAGGKFMEAVAKKAINDIVADYMRRIKEQQNKIEILEKEKVRNE